MECIIPLIITILIIYHYYIIYTEGYIYIYIYSKAQKKMVYDGFLLSGRDLGLWRFGGDFCNIPLQTWPVNLWTSRLVQGDGDMEPGRDAMCFPLPLPFSLEVALQMALLPLNE